MESASSTYSSYSSSNYGGGYSGGYGGGYSGGYSTGYGPSDISQSKKSMVIKMIETKDGKVVSESSEVIQD